MTPAQKRILQNQIETAIEENQSIFGIIITLDLIELFDEIITKFEYFNDEKTIH